MAIEGCANCGFDHEPPEDDEHPEANCPPCDCETCTSNRKQALKLRKPRAEEQPKKYLH